MGNNRVSVLCMSGSCHRHDDNAGKRAFYGIDVDGMDAVIYVDM